MRSKHLRTAPLAPKSRPSDYSGGLTSGGVPGVTCEKFGVLRGHADEEGDSSCSRRQSQASLTPPQTSESPRSRGQMPPYFEAPFTEALIPLSCHPRATLPLYHVAGSLL